MEVQQLIGEIAKRHGILLERGDPSLAAVTMNELLLAEYVQKLMAAIEGSQDQIAIGIGGQLEETKAVVSRLVTGAGAYVADQVRMAGASVQKEWAAVLRRELAAAQDAAREAKASARNARWAASLCLGVVLVIGVLGILRLFGKL